ncbi:DNA helicase [Fusarium acutatum]|uniref:DNA helicase n=1 Tax=Fusarium acutatum TaxID=78861 RepID=A0A8H4J9K5_9HYPO|nr:DNA helicase [Fusarium acutatum]
MKAEVPKHLKTKHLTIRPAGSEGVEDAAAKLMRLHQEQANKSNAAEEDGIKVADKKKEPMICDTFDRLADHAKAAAVPSIVGLAALYQIERKEIHIKPSKLFDNRLEDESWTQYKGYWMKMLRICHHMDGQQDEDRPPYKLTIRQGDLWDEFVEAAEAVVAGQARQNGLTDEKMERLCLDMLIGMLYHQFKQSHYDSIVLSALAIMGINEDGGWVEPTDYTPKYSGVIKVARMLVLYQSWHEREEDVARKMRTIDEDEAREEAKGIHRIVREKSQRFMTRVSEKNNSEPTLLTNDQINSTRVDFIDPP